MSTTITELVEYLKAEHKDPFEMTPDAAPTGSRVICNPPILDTDEDWLVFVPESVQSKAIDWLVNHGAEYPGDQEHYPDGVCFHLGSLNPILIWDWTHYYKWVAATWIVQKLNPQSKEERTHYFAALVDGSIAVDKLKLPACNEQTKKTD